MKRPLTMNSRVLLPFVVVCLGLAFATESLPQGTNPTVPPKVQTTNVTNVTGARKIHDTKANIPYPPQAAAPALSKWWSLIPSIIGGLITGTFAITATWFTYSHNRRLNNLQHQKKINGILMAIRHEVEIAHDIYRRKAGNVIENVASGQPCLMYFSVTEEYFIVYPNNTEIVGQIDDPELCKAIIDVYNTASYVMEGLRVNNWYLDRRSEHWRQYRSRPDGGVKCDIDTVEGHLNNQAPGLKEGNIVLKRMIENLFAKIDDYLQRHPIKT